MFHKILIFKNSFVFIFLILFSSNVQAQLQTFIREYTYIASETDSKVSSRENALDEVKRLLIEELGIYISSVVTRESTESNTEVYKDIFTREINTLSSGITQTKVLEEKWDGYEYYIKAEIKADPEDVIRKINQNLSLQKSSAVIDSLNLLLSQSSEMILKSNSDVIALQNELKNQNDKLNVSQLNLNRLKSELTELKRIQAEREKEEREIKSQLDLIRKKIKNQTQSAINNVVCGMSIDDLIGLIGKPRVNDYRYGYGGLNYGNVYVIAVNEIVMGIVRNIAYDRSSDMEFYQYYYSDSVIKYCD